jgi:hypothetical protein
MSSSSSIECQLFVKWVSENRMLDVRCNPHGTFLDLKKAIEEAGGPLVKDQKFIFAKFSDDELIAPYNLFGISTPSVFGAPPPPLKQ